jgi:DNA invertase Pin-like site-specific DNA recombinase
MTKSAGGRVERPGLAKALEMLREGNTLVVWKLNRLGRNLVGKLYQQGIQFQSITDAIDTLGSFFMSWPACPKWRGS